MKKTGKKDQGISEGHGSVHAGTVEATTEQGKAILCARAKTLAQEPEKEKEAGKYLEVLAFFLAHETYAVETPFIREVYPLTELTSVPCTPDHIFGIINIRGQILTILDMKKFFALPEKGITNLNRVIVIQGEGMELGILADEIIDIRSISEDSLNPPLPTITGIHAGYIKGVSGEGLLLLDMEKFLKDEHLIVHEEVGR